MTLKVGQIWRAGNGSEFRIREFLPQQGTNKNYQRVALDLRQSGEYWDPHHEWSANNGIFNDLGGKWTLVSDVQEEKASPKKPSTKKPTIKVGQVWTCGDNEYRVDKLESTRAFFAHRRRESNGDWNTNGGSYSAIVGGEFPLFMNQPWRLTTDVSDPKPTFRQMIQSDAGKAGYRIAAYQLTKGTKKAILSLMEKRRESSNNIKAVSDLLDTEVGSAFVAMILGMGLTYAPRISNDPRAQRLAGEFRTGSMTTAGNVAFDAMTQHFIPVIVNALQGLPKEHVRISDSLPGRVGENEELLEENEKEARA